MECPKCSNAMESRTFKEVTVDRCTGCRGLFCAPDTIEKMKGMWMTEAVIDMGDATVGKEYNKIDDIQCPECQVAMDKISDPEQPHIWLEACPQCSKVFLDAGEFTDIKFNTVFDRYRDWRKGKRA